MINYETKLKIFPVIVILMVLLIFWGMIYIVLKSIPAGEEKKVNQTLDRFEVESWCHLNPMRKVYIYGSTTMKNFCDPPAHYEERIERGHKFNCCILGYEKNTPCRDNSSLNSLFLEAKPQVIEFELNLINDNSIKAVSPAFYVLKGETLGSLSTPPKEEPIDDIFRKIIWCESRGNPNAKNPSSTARGLLQIIESSEKFCEKGLKKELNMYNPDENLLCGKYLYENGGLKHWQPVWDCIKNYERPTN